MPIRPSDPFFWRHYEGPIILVCVRWYLRLPLSYRQVADLMTERGLGVHASCIWRWVQVFGPELDKRCRPHLKPTNKSYRVDETYIKVKDQDQRSRSRGVNFGFFTERCRTPSWCRSARFSN